MSNRAYPPLTVQLIVAGLLSFSVVYASWAEGGYGDTVRPILTWSMLATGISLPWVRKTISNIWLPWGILSGILLVALHNPTYDLVLAGRPTGPDGDIHQFSEALRPLQSSPWLPGTMEPPVSKPVTYFNLALLICFLSFMLGVNRKFLLYSVALTVAINGGALAIAGIYFDSNSNGLLLNRYEPINDRFFSSFRYNNHWVANAILSGGCAIYFILSLKLHQYVRYPTILMALGILVYAGSISKSRSFLVLCLLLLGMLFFRLFIRSHSAKFNIRTALNAALLLVVAATALYFVGGKVYSDRKTSFTQQISKIREGQLPHRALLARDTAKLVAAKPLWGWGMGCFSTAFPLVAGGEFDENTVNYKTGPLRPQFAHNDWLQYWAEIGTPAMLCLLTPPVMLLLSARKTAIDSTQLCCLGAYLTVGVFAVWDFPLSNPANQVLFAATFALGIKSKSKIEQQSHNSLITNQSRD